MGLTGDNGDLKIISNRVATGDVQIVHPNVSEVSFPLMEKMCAMANSLLTLVPLDDRFTNHRPRIPVSLNFHSGASSLWVDVIYPLGKEFGPLDANSTRVLVQFRERNLVRL